MSSRPSRNRSSALLSILFGWLFLAGLVSPLLHGSIPRDRHPTVELPALIEGPPAAERVASAFPPARLELGLSEGDAAILRRVLVRQNPWSAFDPEGLSGEAVRIGAWTTGGAMTGAALGLMVCAPAGEVPSPVVVPTFAAVGAAAGFIAGAVSEGLNYLANNFSAPRPLFPTPIGGGFSPPPRFDSTTATTPTPALPPLPGFGSTTQFPPLVLGGAQPVQLPNVLITSPDGSSARDIVTAKDGPVEPGQDGTYGGLKGQKARFGETESLDMDHQPSFASQVLAEEARLGRTLTRDEREALRQSTPAVASPRKVHQQTSPTYGARNTKERQAEDAANPDAAAARDRAAFDEGMKKQ